MKEATGTTPVMKTGILYDGLGVHRNVPAFEMHFEDKGFCRLHWFWRGKWWLWKTECEPAERHCSMEWCVKKEPTAMQIEFSDEIPFSPDENFLKILIMPVPPKS